MIRNITEWCDKKFDESIEEDKISKAFISGFVEGLADYCFIVGAALMVIGFINSVLSIFKKNDK